MGLGFNLRSMVHVETPYDMHALRLAGFRSLEINKAEMR